MTTTLFTCREHGTWHVGPVEGEIPVAETFKYFCPICHTRMQPVPSTDYLWVIPTCASGIHGTLTYTHHEGMYYCQLHLYADQEQKEWQVEYVHASKTAPTGEIDIGTMLPNDYTVPIVSIPFETHDGIFEVHPPSHVLLQVIYDENLLMPGQSVRLQLPEDEKDER